MSLGLKMSNGQWLDVGLETEMQLVLNNDIFFSNNPRRSYGFAITLPKTGKNNIELSQLEKLDTSAAATTEYTVDIYDGLVFMFRGQLMVKETLEGYRATFLAYSGSFEETVGDKTLWDYDYADATTSAVDPLDAVDGEYPDYNVQAAHVAMVAEQELLRVGALWSSDNRTNFGYLELTAIPSLERRNVWQVYFMYVLKHIFESENFQTPIGEFIDDEELQQLLFLSNRSIDNASSPNTDFDHEVKRWLPNLKVSDLIQSTSAMFACGFFYSLHDNTVRIDFLKDLPSKTGTDWTEKVSPNGIRQKYNKPDGLTFSTKGMARTIYDTDVIDPTLVTGSYTNRTDVPDGSGDIDDIAYVESQNVYHKVVDVNTTRTYKYNHGYLDLNERETLTAVDDFASLVSVTSADNFKVCTVLDENMWYEVQDGAWRKLCSIGPEFVVGNGARRIESKIGPALMDRGPRQNGDSSDDQFRFPYLPDIKRRHEYEDLEEVLPPLLAFNRGLRDTTGTAKQNCLACSDVFDNLWTKIGDYSLHWDGPYGLYETFWRPWAEFLLNSKEVVFAARLTHLDVATLDFSEPIMIRGKKAFIKSIELKIPLTTEAKLTVVIAD